MMRIGQETSSLNEVGLEMVSSLLLHFFLSLVGLTTKSTLDQNHVSLASPIKWNMLAVTIKTFVAVIIIIIIIFGLLFSNSFFIHHTVSRCRLLSGTSS